MMEIYSRYYYEIPEEENNIMENVLKVLLENK